MITIKIKPWSTIGNLVHSSTSYQVATDIGFNNIIDNHPNDSNNLTVYYSPVVVPAGATYYVRVARNFTNNTSTGWGDPIAVNSTPSNGGLLSYNPVKVFQPVVTVDRAALNDPLLTTYTVTTSAFSGANEGHGETIWIVADDNDKVLHFVRSKTDLTSITLTKRNNMLLGAKYLKFMAIHRTLSNIESPIGSVIVDITNVDFRIYTSSDTHAPGIDLVVNVAYPTNAPNTTVSKIELTDINGNIIWGSPVPAAAGSVIMPGVLFEANAEYVVTAYGVPADTHHKYSIAVHVAPTITKRTINRSMVYRRTVRPLNTKFTSSTALDSFEAYDGRILGLSAARNYTGAITRNADNTFTHGVSMPGTYVAPANSVGMHISPLDNDRLFVDTYAGAGVRHDAKVYNVDYYKNTAAMVQRDVTAGQTAAINNGVVTLDYKTVYVGRNVSNHIDVYNTTVANWKSTIPLPKGVTSVRCITKDMGSNLLLFAQGTPDVYSYNIAKKTWAPKYNLPLVFRNRTLKQQQLANGDVIVWKPIANETVAGKVIADTALDMLYIDNARGTMTHMVPMATRPGNLKGNILLSDGTVLLIEETTGATYLFE